MNFDELLAIIRRCEPNSKTIMDSSLEMRGARNAHGDSLLHIIAAEGDTNGVSALLKIGCDVNSQNRFGSTAIAVAAWREDRSIVSQLIEAGANLALVDSTGFTVIENLRMMGKNEMADFILSRLRK